MFLLNADFDRRLRQLTWCWLSLFYLGFILTLWPGDVCLMNWLRQSVLIARGQYFFALITDYGMYPFYGLFLGLLAFSWRRYPWLNRLSMAYWIAQLLGPLLIVRTLKITFGRPRPYVGESEWIGASLDAAYHSFPSGHTADLFVSAIFTALLFRRRWISIFAFSVAAAVGFTRLALDKHYLTDVVGGLFIGGLTAIIVARWLLSNNRF